MLLFGAVMKKAASTLILISVLLITLFLVVRIPTSEAVSETPEQQWSRSYLGNGGRAIQTCDGGYAIVGMNASMLFYPASERAPILIKTDDSGAVQWRKTFQETGVAGVNSIVQTKDSGFALSGSSIAPPIISPVYSGWLIKTDAQGDIQWRKTFGPMESCYSIQTSDNGFVLVGTISNNVSSVDAVFVKIDSDGNILWDKTQTFNGDSPHVFPTDVVETDDGGYAVTGGWKGYFWLMKTDSDGNLLWNKTYDPVDTDKPLMFQSVSETEDGGYILAGMHSGGLTMQDGTLVTQEGYFAWLVKADSQGNLQWSQKYLSGFTGFSSAVQTSDGGYVAVGQHNRQALLVRTDASGNLLSRDSYGGSAENESSRASSVVLTSDGGFAVSGVLNAYSPTNAEGYQITPYVGNDVWLAKFAPESDALPDNTSPDSVLTYVPVVASVSAIAIVGASLFFYFKKRKH